MTVFLLAAVCVGTAGAVEVTPCTNEAGCIWDMGHSGECVKLTIAASSYSDKITITKTSATEKDGKITITFGVKYAETVGQNCMAGLGCDTLDGEASSVAVKVSSGTECLVYSISIPATSKEVTVSANGLTYWKLEGGVITISGEGMMPDFSGASYAPWSAQKDSINKVVIGEDVQSIGEYSFESYKSLTELDLSNSKSLVAIYYRAFRFCNNLKGEMYLGQSFETFGSESLSGTLIEKYTVHESNSVYQSNKDGILYSKGGDILISVPTGKTGAFNNDWFGNVVEIKASAARGASSFDNGAILKFSESVKNIGSSAFQDCPWIGEVTVPDNVESIGNGAFNGANNITTISLGSGIISIGNTAFSGCTKLEKVNWDNPSPSFTKISGWIFNGCTSLKEFTIPTTVTEVGELAFSNCEAIQGDISHLQKIGGSAFYGVSLGDVVIQTGTEITPYFASNRNNYNAFASSNINNLTFNAAKAPESLFSETTVKSFKLGSTVTEIATSAFYMTAGIVDLTEMVTEGLNIDNHAFKYSASSDVMASLGIIYFDNAEAKNYIVEYYNNENTVYAITNGGKFTGHNAYTEDGSLATPEKTGYNAIWYEYVEGKTSPADYAGKNPVTTPEKGKTYIAVWTVQTPTLTVTSDKTGITTGESVTLMAKATPEPIDGMEYTYQWYANGMDETNKIDGATKATYTTNTQTDKTTYYCNVTVTYNGDVANVSSSATVNILTPSSVTPEAEATLLSNTTGDYAAQFLGKTVKLVNVSLLNAGGAQEHDTEVTFVVTDAQLGIPAGSALKYNFVVLHLNESVNPAIVELVPSEKVKPTENGLQITSKLSPFAIGYSLIPVDKPSGSSSSQGSSVWLMETQTPTPTPTATPTPSDTVPTDIPVTQPTETPDSPAPILGILAGLGCAVAVLRRR